MAILWQAVWRLLNIDNRFDKTDLNKRQQLLQNEKNEINYFDYFLKQTNIKAIAFYRVNFMLKKMQ